MKETTNHLRVSTGGIGFPGVLTILFVVLKAFDVVDWSWWVVFSPMLALAAIITLLLVVVAACFLIASRR